MTCREFIEFLMAYLDGELPPEQSKEFDDHLAKCTDCKAYLDSYRKTVEVGKRAFAPGEDREVPEEVPENLVKAILAARRSR